MKAKREHSFPQVCAKCGKELDQAMKFYLFDNNFPAACAEHLQDVLEEASKGYGMWPSDWAGRSWLSGKVWRYE